MDAVPVGVYRFPLITAIECSDRGQVALPQGQDADSRVAGVIAVDEIAMQHFQGVLA